MANIKSAKKRVLTSRVRQERNKAVKSSVKTAIKKVEAAVREADKDAAAKELLSSTRLLRRVSFIRTTHPARLHVLQSWSTPHSKTVSSKLQ